MGDNSVFIKVGPAGSGVITSAERSAITSQLIDYDGTGVTDYYEFDEREAWDEKGRCRISQIFIWHSKQGIHSLQFRYVDGIDGSDSFVMSDRHGKGNGSKFDVVKLSSTSQTEYITWIGGHTFGKILCSITFGTNLRRYGPFGGKSDNVDEFELDKVEEFNFQIGEGNLFGGFYGAFNKSILTAIGFYMMLLNN